MWDGIQGAWGDIQRLIRNLNSKLGSLGSPPRGTQGGPDRAPRQGANWDCALCSEGVDNFADRARCFKCGGARPRPGQGQQGQARPLQARPARTPRARSRQPRAPSQQALPPQAKADTADRPEDPATSANELATARSLYEWE